MNRRNDWDQRLAFFLACQAKTLFAWGEHDCCTFAAGAVYAMTGKDPIAEFRGRYSTQRGAVLALKRYGGGDLESTIDAKFSERKIGFARRGDLAFVARKNDGLGCVGVVTGSDAQFVGTNDGKPALLSFVRSDWSKAWSVG